MAGSSDKALLREAVEIFLKLEEDPRNPELLAQRDAFLARGAPARRAYDKAMATWQATDLRPKRPKLGLVILATGLALGGYLLADDLRVALMADAATRFDVAQSNLASGDLVFLDAGSAIVDDTRSDDAVRAVKLMEGAAFFEVRPSRAPFVVSLGDLDVTVIGTAFETAFVGEEVSVQVTEGQVEVSDPSETWVLAEGDRLEWSAETGATLSHVEPGRIAAWRMDQLVVQGARFDRVAEIIGRRLPGDIVIMNEALRAVTVSGSFDLSDPETALRVLTATQNAKIVSGRPFATLIYPGK